MSQSPDYFSDMLSPGEQILASVGGPGPVIERKVGQERTWFQLAVTQTRFLAVRLAQGPLGDGYQPQDRLAAGKEFVRIARFPRTATSSARLEITGCGNPIHLMDIDDSSIFPYVEPFLQAWGGHLEGAGVVRLAEPDPDVQEAVDTKLLMIVAGVGIAMLAACCGCAGVSAILRAVLGA